VLSGIPRLVHSGIETARKPSVHAGSENRNARARI
jgi:hypothetical protein